MSRGKHASNRLRLDDATILALCDGRTCCGIAVAMRENYAVVKRHLLALVRNKRIAGDLRGRRVYYRVTS